MSIETQMDEARVPFDAQRMSIPDFSRCEGMRGYVEDVREQEPGGINFMYIADVCNNESRLTLPEAKTLFWVFVKELILSNRTVMVVNPQTLINQLGKTTPWVDDFPIDYVDHLFLSNFFRAGQPCPFTAKEISLLLNYIGERYEYGKTTHVAWEFRNRDRYKQEAVEWYPELWLDFWFEEQTAKVIQTT